MKGMPQGWIPATQFPVLWDVHYERIRQDEKCGEQNHPNGTSQIFTETANTCRVMTDMAAKRGRLTWAHILNEEFYEAMSEEDPEKLREELIQVAAVAVAWAECIDRRKNENRTDQG